MHLLSQRCPVAVPDQNPDTWRSVGSNTGKNSTRPSEGSDHVASTDTFDLHRWPGRHPDARSYRHAIAVPLILLGVIVVVEIREIQARPIGEGPELVGDMPLGSQQRVNLLAALDHFAQLSQFAPDHQPHRGTAVQVGMSKPVAEHAVSLSAAFLALHPH